MKHLCEESHPLLHLPELMSALAAGHPSAKRSLQPAFDAAAAQAGLPLYGLQPFEPLVLDDIDPGLHTPHFPGPSSVLSTLLAWLKTLYQC